MAGDHPNPGTGDTSGRPQEQRGVSLGRTPAADPAAVADQPTQLGGAPVPAPAGADPKAFAPPAAPAAPAAPPAATRAPAPPQAPGPAQAQSPAQAPGSEYAYQPTAAAFPAQSVPQSAPPPAPRTPYAPYAQVPPGAPVGPFDPYAGTPPQPLPGQAPPPGYGYGYGYGYPQQAPPPAPGHPQHQGYPPQAGYGFPAPPPPVARKRNPVLLFGGVIGGVLAVAIVIGLVVLLGDTGTEGGGGTAGGGGGGGTTTARGYNVTWAAAKAKSGGAGTLLGAWTTDTVVVRGDASGIAAYGAGDGTPAWTVAPPAGTKEFCSMSAAVNSRKIVAVSLNTGDGDCSTLGAVDLGTGKLLWSRKVGDEKVYSPTLSVTEKVVTLGSAAALGGFSVADGTPAWNYRPRDENCSVYAGAAGATVVVSDRCYSSKISTKSVLQVLDADTGKAAAQLTLTGSSERLRAVISAEPLVVQMSDGSDGDYLMGFDTAGKPTAKLPVKEAGSDSLQFSDASDPFTLNVVSGTTLYVQDRSGEKYAVKAFDLATGKKLWEQDGGARQGLRLVSGTDADGSVRAVAAEGYSDPARLVKLGPGDGAVTDVAALNVPKNQLMIYSLTEFDLGDDGSLVAFTRSSSISPVMRFAKK